MTFDYSLYEEIETETPGLGYAPDAYTTLYKCKACRAIILDEDDTDVHTEWHTKIENPVLKLGFR